MNLSRVSAIIIRHYFMTLHHMERFFDVFIYPVMALLVWGFLSKYVANISSPTLASFLLGGLILWVIFERIETDIGLSFMYDVWERNVVSFLATPITFLEYIIGLIFISIIKIIISFLAMWLIASVFYNFQITIMGFAIAFFWVNLFMSALAFGIFNISMVLRFGHGVGPLTWILPFFIQPFAGVFYPVSVLPEFFQKIAGVLPLSYVFEGMRYTLNTGKIDFQGVLISFLLNIIYVSASITLFALILNSSRKSGRLVKLN